MAERLFIPTLFLSREQLREMGLRVYGETHTAPAAPRPEYPLFHDKTVEGHFVAASAVDKIAEAGFQVRAALKHSAEGEVTPEAYSVPGEEGDVGKMCLVTYQNGVLAAPGLEAPQGSVKIGNNQGHTLPLMYELELRALAHSILHPVVKHPISIDVPHGVNATPNADPSVFVIHVYSSARTGATATRWDLPEDLNSLFGVRLSDESICRDGLDVDEWEEGVQLRTPEGFSFGQFDANNLYIFTDLVHVGNKDEMAIWAELMKYVVTNFARTAGPNHEEMRARYVEVAAKRNQAVLVKMKREAEESQAEVQRMSASLGQLCIKRDKLFKELKRSEEDTVSDNASLAREYDNIVKMPFIKKVRLTGNVMTVFTDMIFVTDPRSKKEHEIGIFKVSFDLDRVITTLLNQTRQVVAYEGKQMHHPHIFPNGTPCLGSLEESLPMLLREFRLCDAVGLIYGYLCTVNVDDGAGKHVSKWPLSEAQKAKDTAEALAARRVAEAAVVPAVEGA